MPKKTNPRRQREQKHPEEWRRDLSPERMAGQNIGGVAEAHEGMTHTAYDVKPVHRALDGSKDDELKQIPDLEPRTRLRQGATYLDLERGAFTATGEMAVDLVPKDGVHDEMWNRLAREEKRWRCGMAAQNPIAKLTLATAVLMLALACHPGPIINRSEQRVGGTIAGIVATTKGATALNGRKVTAVDVVSGTRYDATTNITGGYTIKVPEGTYRLELETREGETLTKKPDETHVNNGDLDSGRDFEVTVSAGRS